jgi:hypothetical protein
MPKFVLRDAHFMINAVDLSDHVKQIELTIEATEVDVTSMGNSGYSSQLPGMKKWQATVTMFNDFDAAKTDATIFPLAGGAVVPVIFRPVKATAISATNPEYRGDASVLSYAPISGSVNEAAMTAVRLSGNGALTRNIV